MEQKHAIMAVAIRASAADNNGNESSMDEAMVIKDYFIESGIISDNSEFMKLFSETCSLREKYDDFYDEDIKISLPSNLRKTAFALAVKVVMADGEISDDEVDAINDIGDWLEILQKDRDMIIDVLAILSDKPEE